MGERKPVLIVVDVQNGPFERLLGWIKMVDSPEIEIVDDLATYIGPRTPIIDKHIYSLFTPEGTQLVSEEGLDGSLPLRHRYRRMCTQDRGRCRTRAHNTGLLIAGRFIGTRQIIPTNDLPQSVLAASLLPLPQV
ncbi:MAG: hypothetical protein ACRDRX_02460 [Pseudonocardiaceae bacterium]